MQLVMTSDLECFEAKCGQDINECPYKSKSEPGTILLLPETEMVNYELVIKYRTECPWSEISEDIYAARRMYTEYKAGHLWKAGAIEDQPIYYLNLMEAFTSAENAEIKRQTDERNENIRSDFGLKG